MREYIITTERLGFSVWTAGDIPLAEGLWGDFDVVRMFTGTPFTKAQIEERLAAELYNWKAHGIQYWPLFLLDTGEFIGCCGLRPYNGKASKPGKKIYEMGFHLHKKFWKQGFGFEAASAVLDYGFNKLGADWIAAGHHPENEGSRALLGKLGLICEGGEFYEPTGLIHPIYLIERGSFCGNL